MPLHQKLLHTIENWVLANLNLNKDQDEWQMWREKIILYSLIIGSVMILIAFIPSIILLTYENRYILLAFSSIFLISFLCLIFIKQVSYSLRAWGICILLFMMGTSIIFIRGPFTSGLLWLFLSMVACAVLLNLKAAVISFQHHRSSGTLSVIIPFPTGPSQP